MNNHLTSLRRISVALLLLVAFLCQETWALAGTTGSIGGNVTDDSGKPIAGAKVSVTSPSQSATSVTDGAGHYIFLALAPDTYTISVSKDGFSPVSQAGASVFADQIQNIAITMHSALRTIASVTSRATGSLVKSGTTSDIYSVNAATQQAVSGLGGGGNLNSAYSAIYSVPGVNSTIGNYGFGQVFYIRGSNYNQVGYEFDGVPVNRAFDNYNGSSLSSLGQQELQVYTGANPAGASTATVGGYVNQVIKTGTFPGFGVANLGIGAPTFYHQASVEAGGASPDRNFSYYAAIGGDNQEFRQFNQQNGGNLGLNTGLFGFASEFSTQYFGNGAPACNADGSTPGTGYGTSAGCIFFPTPGGSNYQSGNSDRETVMNFHFALPHKNDGGRDDIQLLYTGSSFHTAYAESLNDLGGIPGLNANYGGDFCGATGACAGNQLTYFDGYRFAPGTTFGQSAASATVIPYYFPNTGTNRPFDGPMPANQRSTIFNDSQIVKLQYQKNFGSRAYARIYGYSLYSDWLQNSPTEGLFAYGLGSPVCCSGGVSPDYELSAHTRGGEFTFADQFNSQNLIQFTANYVTSGVQRFNNGTYRNQAGTSATNLLDAAGNCYSYKTGTQTSCLSSSTAGTFSDPTRTTTCAGLAAAGTPCVIPAGTSFVVTVPGERGTYNTVVPKFSSAALTDEWRPNDRLDVNFGVRFERFEYDLATPGTDFPFWYNAAANSYCYNLSTLAPLLNPLPFGAPPPATPAVVNGPCPTIAGVAYAHPSATDPANTRGIVYNAGNGGAFASNLYSPRIAGTYTINPDTVIRASYGRYAEPDSTAGVQYLDKSGKSSAAFNFANFFQYGYNTPNHNLVPQTSNNADLSLEKRLHGTDISFKLSPFYRYTTNQLNTIAIGPNFASFLNSGTQRTYGVEFALSKGDPSRNGLAGQIAYTYTNARIRFTNLSNGRNGIDPINDYINEYNALTKGGGGSPCYDPTNNGAPTTCTGNPTAIVNPYYNAPTQPLLDRNGWYEPYPNEAPYQPPATEEAAIAPNVFSGYINYKHDKLTVTPTFQLNQGTTYGSPVAIYGFDPRFCGANQSNAGANPYTGSSFNPVPGTDTPQNANYLTCGPSGATGNGFLAIPNPQTGKFDTLGQYRNPWQFNLGVQVGYDVTPKIHATALLANLVNRCFGGSKTSWSSAFPAGNLVCGYNTNASYYQSNFYNGSSPSNAANPAQAPIELQPYGPVGIGLPFNAYFSVQIKL